MATGVMDHYLRESAIRFSRKTRIISRTICFDGQCGLDEYHIELEDGYVIHEVCSVKVDDCCLDPVCDKCHCSTGKFKYHAGVLTICNFSGCEIEVEVIAMPSRTTCEIDEDIIQQWGDVIANGANAKLMMSNDKRWKNLGVARFEEQLFQIGVEEAQVHVQRGGLVPKVWHAPKSNINYGCCDAT